MNMTRYKANLSSMMTSKPDCDATLVEEGRYRLVEGGAVQLTGQGSKEVQRGRYCLDRGRVRVCQDDRPEKEELVQLKTFSDAGNIQPVAVFLAILVFAIVK